MGSDPDIAVPLSEPGADLWICAQCVMAPTVLLALLQDEPGETAKEAS